MSVTAAIAALLALSGTSPSSIEGYWKNPIGSAIIAITPCGALLCGKVVWASARGKREAAKGASNVVGTTVLTGLKSTDGRWSGRLFIPDDNIHVTARLQLIGNQRLKLTGCGLMGLICRTQIWSRVDGPLPTAD